MHRNCILNAVILIGIASSVHATGLTITPTFDPSITSDPNAASIEATINSAIGVYESLFSNPVNVTILFQEMGSGLGQSEKTLYGITYASGAPSSFYDAYVANSALDPVAATALADNVVPNTANNPVTGSPAIAMSTADIRALGIAGSFPSGVPGGYDGIIGLNTSITTPGSPGSSLTYSLLATAEHEIDEVLGLGSSLAQSFQQGDPSIEDLFRYGAPPTGGVGCSSRSYTTVTTAKAYLSVDGATCLAQFDNQNDGGDWGDWQSNPRPGGVSPQVQDAFATPLSSPTLGSNEITALEAIGYDLTRQSGTPEPATFGMMGLALVGVGLLRRKRIGKS